MAKPNSPPEGPPDSGDDQPGNKSWVVGAIIAIAVLAGILSLIGLWANKETVPSAAPSATDTSAPTAAAMPTASAAATPKVSAAATPKAKSR